MIEIIIIVHILLTHVLPVFALIANNRYDHACDKYLTRVIVQYLEFLVSSFFFMDLLLCTYEIHFAMNFFVLK